MDQFVDFSIKEANEIIKSKLSAIAKSIDLTSYGKTPSVININGSLVIRFTYQKKQQNFRPGLGLTQDDITEARSIAIEIGKKLLFNQFTLAWLETQKRKKVDQQAEKNIYALWQEFKLFFKESKPKGKFNQDQLWFSRQGEQLDRLFDYKQLEYKHKYTLTRLDCQWLLNHAFSKGKKGKGLIDDTTTRSNQLKRGLLKNFLEYIDQPVNILGEPIKRIKIKESPYCTDQQILNAVQILENNINNGPKRFQQNNIAWLFFLKVLAVWGLRPHEFWNIKNWSNSVKLINGDYVPDPAGNIKAINDPDNKSKILAIGKDTKTGARLVLPVAPKGLGLFSLAQESFKLPLLTDPLEIRRNNSYKCSHLAGHFFIRNKLGFNPYQLRHAYAHRCDRQKIRPNLAAQSMGHSLNVHNATYLSTYNQDQLLQDFYNELEKND